MFKRIWVYLFALFLPISYSLHCAASAYDAHPKLVVILVVDQFREDYLERYRTDFKGEGFNLFLDHGAFFPNCYFDYGNLVTAPGHATIATGAYTDGHGIAGNSWWDLARNTTRPITSVEDPRYSIVGLPANSTNPVEGASPRNLLASTIGDEVRLATGGEAKLFSVSLKDRAAILLAGHTANGAFWIDPKSGAFITSTYYMNSLPSWATAFNLGNFAAEARTGVGAASNANFVKTIGPTDAAIQYELDFAEALIQGENLGSGNVTDVLTISISSTDMLGHKVGPDSPEQRELVDELDGNLGDFFHWLDRNVPGGLRNVWIALSADHGVAPLPAAAQQLGIPAATIDVKALVAALNTSMNDRFSPGQNLEYMLPDQHLPYIALNIPVFERAGINELEGERAIQDAVPAAMSKLDPAANEPDSKVKPVTARVAPAPRIVRTFTRLQMAALQPGLPPTEFGRLIAHSYSPNGGWYVMLIPEAYQMQASGSGTTHFSPYSYDRHVPLAFYGSAFAPGTYRERVQPVDLAATLAALLNVNQPSASIGKILTEAIAPELAARPGRTPIRRGRRRAEEKSETPSPAKSANPASSPQNPPAVPNRESSPATSTAPPHATPSSPVPPAQPTTPPQTGATPPQ
ncbi:MAG: alkaline phosphatase family protein [Acidobacteriaceae bacterium]